MAVKQASQVQYATGCTQDDDFRMCGPAINADLDTILVSLRSRPNISKSSGSARGLGATLREPRVTWITTESHVLEALTRRHKIDGDLSPTDVFQELVASLGLKSWHKPTLIYSVELYRQSSKGVLRRPHSFSVGYADRFCGASSYASFGSTADNRSGASGLPEAIAFDTRLDAIQPAHKAYQGFREAVQKLASWVVKLPQDSFIEHELNTADLHASDTSYVNFQRAVVGRLGEQLLFCHHKHGTIKCVETCRV